MKITITIPDDLAKIMADRAAKFEEPEIVTLPDGRKATASRKKYGPDPLTEWVNEAVFNNLLAVAPEWFDLQEQAQLEETERQRKMRQAALDKLKGAQ